METQNEITYKIISKTDLYHAYRHAGYNKHTGIKVCSEHLTLREAHAQLLQMFCQYYESNLPNWGAACLVSRTLCLYASPTFSDGTRCFNYDVFTYSIECENDEEFIIN